MIRIVGDPITSPSTQLRITPTQNVEILSTHDQLLTHDKSRELCVQCHLGPNLEVQGRGRTRAARGEAPPWRQRRAA